MPNLSFEIKCARLLVFAILTGCGYIKSNAGEGQLEDFGSSEAAKNLQLLVQDLESSADFLAEMRQIGGVSVSQFGSSLARGMSDGHVNLGNRSFGQLKSAFAKTDISLPTLKQLDRKFASINELFAANGLVGKITQGEVVDYLKVASLGMRGLTGEGLPMTKVTTKTMAGALRVALAMTTLKFDSAQGSLGLAAGSGKPTKRKSVLKSESTVTEQKSSFTKSAVARLCGSYQGSAPEGQWICYKDTLGGSIGFYANAQKTSWQDAYSGSTYAVCPAVASAGDWGWVADASSPDGGHPCHNPVSINKNEVQKLCNKGADSFECESVSGQSSSGDIAPGLKAAAPAADSARGA